MINENLQTLHISNLLSSLLQLLSFLKLLSVLDLILLFIVPHQKINIMNKRNSLKAKDNIKNPTMDNYVDNIGLYEWWCQFISGLNKLYYWWICALYLYGKFLFKSLIFISNETSILPQVVDQVKIPHTSIQYCFIIMLFVVFSLSPLKALVCNLD